MKLNRDDEKRQELLAPYWNDYIKDKPWIGGTRHFQELPADAARNLIEEGFADPDDCQNDAPSYGEITEFLEANPSFTGHGYAVELERSDYRVTLEGVEGGPVKTAELQAFVDMFSGADEFQVDIERLGGSAWYD